MRVGNTTLARAANNLLPFRLFVTVKLVVPLLSYCYREIFSFRLGFPPLNGYGRPTDLLKLTYAPGAGPCSYPFCCARGVSTIDIAIQTMAVHVFGDILYNVANS